MPIPTDTLWNIKRLNWIFAISAVLLVGITLASVFQDYNRDWRQPQRDTVAWDLAMVEDRIQREQSAEQQAHLAELEQQIRQYEATIGQSGAQTEQIERQIRDLVSQKSTIEYALNLDKSELTVAEAHLQDALAAGDSGRANALEAELAPLRASVAAKNEQIAALNDDIAAAREELSGRTAELDALKRERNAIAGDIDLLRKKLESLDPSQQPGWVGSTLGPISASARRAPLLQFINPSEKVQQIVLPDVLTDLGGFKKVESIDRCTTCHVNIARPEFAEANVLAFLEEQVATGRQYVLPEEWSGRAADPVATIDQPGPTALPEFWHSWTVQLLPGALTRNKARLGNITKLVGNGALVTVDGGPLDEFNYDPTTTDPDLALQQEGVLVQLIEALLTYQPPAEGELFESASPPGLQPEVLVEIVPSIDPKLLDTARRNAMRYVEEVAKSLHESLEPDEWSQLQDRYRYALVDTLNGFRAEKGLAALDASPVLLAHPDLDLYVTVDSRHPMEAVGCTSCHDGSGMETDFVLAAHVARPIWVDRATGQPVLPSQLRPTESQIPHEPEAPTLASMLRAVYPAGAVVPEQASQLHFAFDSRADAVAPHTTLEDAPEDGGPIRYVDPVTGQVGKAVSQMRHWRETYEPGAPRSFALVYHEWDRPMLPPQYLQANCVRCHTASYDIAAAAPVVHRGRTLFKDLGCANCHQMSSLAPELTLGSGPNLMFSNGQRKVGPDLRHVTAKLSPAMINTWVWAPKAFRPSTNMPHFFMLENNSSPEELRRTKQETRSITEYLVRTAGDLPPKYPIPDGLQGSAEAGRMLFRSLGCLGCHTNLADTTGATRTTDTGPLPVTVAEQWIITDLVENGRLAQEITAKTGTPPKKEQLEGEAQSIYDAMSYNERQLYVLENLGVDGAVDEPPTYPSGTPKPMFVHHGPELSGIGTKLLAGRTLEQARQWAFDWLMEPSHYSEYTVMPRLRLEPQEAIDLTAYLLEQKRTNLNPDDTWNAGMAEPDSAKLIEMTAMLLHSRFSEQTARQKADDEAELLTLATDALTTADTDAATARQRAEELTKDQQRMVFLGKKLIAQYGCMSCHAINGTEGLATPCTNLSDWGSKGVDKLDFGYLDEHKHSGPHRLPTTTILPLVNGLSADAANLVHEPMSAGTASAPTQVSWPTVEHTRTSWITQKLKNTRIFDRGRALLEPDPSSDNPGRPYEKLKMPAFYLNDRDVDALVTFVISNRDLSGRDPLISQRLHDETVHDQAMQIAEGRLLVEAFNCVGCHRIENNLPPVQQYYKADELTTVAPPSLRGEGNKIQHDWLFNFLRDVEPLRPLPVIRMPSFPISDREAGAIAAYFHAVSEKESQDLRELLTPVIRYVDAQIAASDQPLYTESPWPGDDWYRRSEFARAADRLGHWGLENGQITAIQLDPTKYAPDEMGRNYRTLLYKARFVIGLYDSPYPFTDSPRPLITDERFKRGESLFYEMQCLKCHYMGDPTAPGAAQNPTAPNLGQAYRRLQRRWIRHWVQEPAVIQTGTSMPPFLTGLSVFSDNGMTWPRSQGVSGDEAIRVEALYGTTPDEQADLLLDFLLAAGARGYTAVQPTTPGPLAGLDPVHQPNTQPSYSYNGTPVVVGMAPEAPEPQVATPEPTPDPAPAAPQGVTVSGHVTLTGAAPEPAVIDMSGVAECAALHPDEVSDPSLIVSDNGDLQNVIVWIEGIDGSSAGTPDPAVLDQQGCMYHPHVLAMQTGQSLVVSNSDPFLHNVHALSRENPGFNIGQPHLDAGRNVGAMRVAELFQVKCDVHPWMSAYIRVFDHPFFAVSQANGTFSIPSVPPGTYTLHAWHETLGTREQPITIEPGQSPGISLSFDAASARSTWLEEVQMAMAGEQNTCPACEAADGAELVLRPVR